jgi:hypothetical protein
MVSKKFCAPLFSLMIIISIIAAVIPVSLVKADITSEPKISYDTWDGNTILRGGGEQSHENLSIAILSPLPCSVLSKNGVNVRVNVSTEVWPINSVYYTADWQEGMRCIYDVSDHNQTVSIRMLFRLSITANFTDIPDGNHRLTIYAYIHDGSQGSSSVDFTINAPPSITILSLENKTYQNVDLPLDFTVNEPIVWAGYSLDEKENVTLGGNGTRVSLTNGLHILTVYANDTSGNMGASQTIYFSVDMPLVIVPLNSFQTIVTIAVAIIIIVIIGVGLQIYRERTRIAIPLRLVAGE